MGEITIRQPQVRLKTLIAFGANIFLLDDHESIRFWKSGLGFDAAGLDYLIKTRKEYYIRRLHEPLKKGDRVAVLISCFRKPATANESWLPYVFTSIDDPGFDESVRQNYP